MLYIYYFRKTKLLDYQVDNVKWKIQTVDNKYNCTIDVLKNKNTFLKNINNLFISKSFLILFIKIVSLTRYK